MKGSIQVKDRNGAMASMFELQGVASLAAITSLAADLDSFTCGKILTASVTESNVVPGVQEAEDGPYCLANQKAVLTFRDLDATGTKGTACIIRIPAPDSDLFVMGENGDFIVSAAQGAALAAMINSRLGRNLEFVRGVLATKPRKK